MATIGNRFVTALGPIKMEAMSLTAVTDADTVESLLVRPLFAMAVEDTDLATIAVAVNIGISGKTLTFNSTDLSAATMNMIVFGF